MTAESAEPFATTASERLAQIVNSYLQGNGFSGKWGRLEIIERSSGRIFIVTLATGEKAAVFATQAGWSVAPYTASDNPMPPSRSPDLETAARLALGET